MSDFGASLPGGKGGTVGSTSFGVGVEGTIKARDDFGMTGAVAGAMLGVGAGAAGAITGAGIVAALVRTTGAAGADCTATGAAGIG